MKYTWMVIDNVDENGKRYAHAWRWYNGNNLVCLNKQFPSADIIMACDSMKQAKETARAWNDTYKKDGRYMFG